MLKPEVSVPVALATAAVVYGTYQIALPTLADARSVEADNAHLAGAERAALFVSVGVAGGISLIAKDPTPFILGGLFAVALTWAHRYANQVDPATGRLSLIGQAKRFVVETAG